MDAISSQLNHIWNSNSVPPDIFLFIEQHGELSEEELVAILLVDLGHRWKTETPLKVEEYLAKLSQIKFRRQSKIELALGEFRARGLKPTAENILDYLTRFEDLRDELSIQFEKMAKVTRTLNELTYDFSQGSTLDSDESSDKDGALPHVRYELRSVLGEGAFGRVYQGFDHELQRLVAIKFPNDKRLANSKDREQYIAEARTVASLNHPNIVPVYDIVRRDDGSVYIVSKFIDGCTLEQQTRDTVLSFADSCNIVASVANALDHAHQNRIVHRDVKPGNILLERDTGIAYITDFGLAIKGEQAELQGRVSGTPPYMSPEQVRGESHKLDGRSDIFSLGAILYELLTGERPFGGETPQEVFWEVINTNPPTPRTLNPAVPEELERICMKALAKDVSQRYSSAGGMASELLRWRRSEKYETLDSDSPVRSPFSNNHPDTEENANSVTLVNAAGTSPRSRAQEQRISPAVVSRPRIRQFTPAKISLSVAALLLLIAGGTGILFDVYRRNKNATSIVEFRTTPSHAAVFVVRDNQEAAVDEKEGMRTLSLIPGEYRIRIRANGFEDVDTSFVVPPLEKANMRGGDSNHLVKEYELKPRQVVIRLENYLPNLKISSQGKNLDVERTTNSIRLLPGEHLLHIECDGYIPVDQRVVITSERDSLALPKLKIPVVLSANVQDAEFFLSGEKLKPLSEKDSTYELDAGEANITCTKADYESISNLIHVSTSERSFRFELMPKGAIVRFTPTAVGLKVFENGVERKEDPQWMGYLFSTGEHKVRIERFGYLPQDVAFSITDKNHSVMLEPWKLVVQLKANVADATFWLNDQKLIPIEGSASAFAIKEGVIPIVVRANGFEALSRTLDIHLDANSFHFDLPVKAALSTIPKEFYQDDRVVVRVSPPHPGKLQLQFGNNRIPLTNGLGQLERSFFEGNATAWNYQLLIDDKQSMEGQFTKAELEENGSRPTLEITLPLSDEERGRKMWYMTRPYLKTRPHESELQLDEALKFAPQLYEIYRDRAICRAQQERFDEGEEDYQSCVAHLPKDYLVQCVGGLIAVGRGDYVQARSRLDQAIALRPNSSYALVLQAMLMYRLKNNSGAKTTLLDLVKNTGEADQLAFAKTLLAQIAFDDGDFETAMRYFSEAQLHQVQAGIDPSEIQANQARGMVRFAKKIATSDSARAEKLLREAQALLTRIQTAEGSPLFVRVRMDLAEIEYALGGYQTALQMYSYLIDQLQIENPRLLQNRALVYEKLGMAQAAEMDRQRAAKLREQADR